MKFITTLICAFLFSQLNAQGWDRNFNDSIKVNSLCATSDGGCIILGNGYDSNIATVVKVDAQGKKQWSREYPNLFYIFDPFESGRVRIRQDNKGNYWAGISSFKGTTVKVAKFDKDGNILFMKSFDIVESEVNVLDDNLLILGHINGTNSFALTRLNANGETISTKTVFTITRPPPTFVTLIQKNSLLFFAENDTTKLWQAYKLDFDGKILSKNTFPIRVNFGYLPSPLVKTSDDGVLVSDSAFVSKLDSNGKFLWRKTANYAQPNVDYTYYRYLVAPTIKNGGYIAIENFNTKKYLEIRRFTKDGDFINSSKYFYENTFDLLNLRASSKGGFYISGNSFGNKLRLIRLDENGYFYPNFIKGNIYGDKDLNCRFSGSDFPINRVIVIAKRTGQPDVLTLTDSLGKYNLNVDAGTYSVSIVNPNRYMTPCTPSVSKTISTTNSLDSVDFPLKADFYCGLMQVDVATPRLRRCFNNTYIVSYCNKGTALATDAYVNVTLDSLLEFVAAGKIVASKTGRTYRFNLGNIGVNECKTFDLVARVRCNDSTRIGQTLCVSAKIYPDTLCNPNDNSLWSGASLVVNGSCQGDSVLFTIQNTGKVASLATRSVILENETSNALSIAPLAVNAVFSKKVLSNGNTWRMIVDQVTNHPRSIQPTAFVEGCRKNTTIPFTTGFASNFANDDSDISIDIDCQPIIGSYDPNDKIGFPLGLGVNKSIPQNQDIEFMIRFQNTGTDTAFTVVIRDTIDTNLDVKSIEWGASSHRYTPQLVGENIVKFTFDNILLVDSFTNEPKSNGYVKFRIKQKKDVAFGTKIQGRAGIYFDFNDPIITNKTLHTVSKNLISAIIEYSNEAYEPMKVYPNPSSESIYFEFAAHPLSISTSDYQFELFDLTGKRVRSEQFNGKTFELKRQSLQTGIYLFKIMTEGKLVNVGKVVVD